MTKLVLCIFLAFTLPTTIHAQQLTASLADPGTLPDAPIPQASADSSSSSAQPQAATQSATTPQQPLTAEQRKAAGDAQVKAEEHQRIAGILPAFNSVQSDRAVTLTAGQKFHLFFRGSIDPYQFAIAAADAGIEEAQDQYPEYHWGVSGFAKRYAASYADSWDGNFWGNAVLPAVLHQDPRYYRLGRASGKTAWHRFFYAAATTVICHGDNGKWQPNISNVAGNFIGGAISNIYYPASDRGVGLTIERGFTTTAEGVVGAELVEFYPDYQAWRQRRHERKLTREGTPPTPPAPATTKQQ